MKKTLFICLMLLTAALIRAETLTGTAIRVQDGDSFILRNGDVNYKIRLYGIDAPEKKQPWGGKALMTMIELIGQKEVIVEVMDRDKYRRYVGKVYQGETYINLKMLELGCAWWYKRYAPKDTDLEAAFNKARTDKVGMWEYDDNIEPEKWRISHKEKAVPAATPAQEENTPK